MRGVPCCQSKNNGGRWLPLGPECVRSPPLPPQVEAIQRVLHDRSRGKFQYTAIIFGDFNNRLVCTDARKADVVKGKAKPGKTPKMELSPQGVATFLSQLRDPVQRRAIFLEQDSWVWKGAPPPFLLTIDNLPPKNPGYCVHLQVPTDTILTARPSTI